MKLRPFRIPKNIVLPGVVVHVQVFPRESPQLEGDGGSWSYDEPNGAGPSASIYIAQDLSLPVQRYTLIHELGHVTWDYMHMALKYFPNIVVVG